MSPDVVPHCWTDEFETGDVRAWPLADTDAALFVALYGDAVTMKQVGSVLDRHAAERAFAAARRQMQAHPPLAWYWCLDAGSDARGLLSLVPDADGPGAETGVLLPPALQARGVATTALGHLCDAVFSARAFDALWTRHRHNHRAAAGLMRRLGFKSEATAGQWQRWRLHRATWHQLVKRLPPD